jgi:broad specificity phosphatase PhoE
MAGSLSAGLSASLLESVAAVDLTAVLATAFVIMGIYLVLVVAAGTSLTARAILFKTSLFTRSVSHLLLSREKAGWPKNRADPDVAKGMTFTSVKRVIFVRHGESTWNEVFNRGFGPMFPVRLLAGLAREAAMLVSRSSFFVDSPLSALGYRQAKDLRAFLASDAVQAGMGAAGAAGAPARAADAAALLGVSGTSIVVASNLRRAVATTAIAFWDRLARTGEKVYVLSSLQEMARNVDAYALAGTREAVPLHGIEAHLAGYQAAGFRKGESGSVVGLNCHFNAGNKPIARNGMNSMTEFAAWAAAQDAHTIIAGGHSLWFKEFFKAFLPKASTHKSKKKKIVNCGVVAFTIQHAKHAKHGDLYRIDPDSIDVIYGGFHK